MLIGHKREILYLIKEIRIINEFVSFIFYILPIYVYFLFVRCVTPCLNFSPTCKALYPQVVKHSPQITFL